MNQKGFWIIMSFVLVIIFASKFSLSGKIDLTKVPLGKMLALYGKDFLNLFLRTKTLLKGGSNVMTRVRLVHNGIRFRCTGEPDRQPGAGHGLRERLGRGLGDKEMTCKASRRSTGSKRVTGARRAAV